MYPFPLTSKAFSSFLKFIPPESLIVFLTTVFNSSTVMVPLKAGSAV